MTTDDMRHDELPAELASLSTAALLALSTGHRGPLGTVPERVAAELRASGLIGRRAALTRAGRRASHAAAAWVASPDGRAAITTAEQCSAALLDAIADVAAAAA